jgi:signal transduction histidine kinase
MSEKDRRDPGAPGKGRERLEAVPPRPDERLAAALEELEVTQTHLAHSEKLASIGQLAAGVAHEINNPIGYISSNLNSLGQYVRDIKRVVVAYGELVEAFGRGAPDVLERAEAVRQLKEDVDLEYILWTARTSRRMTSTT